LAPGWLAAAGESGEAGLVWPFENGTPAMNKDRKRPNDIARFMSSQAHPGNAR
jgi:hypothetical protein